MLTNFDLENLAHKFNLPLVSICMKDKLPTKVHDGNYIINLQSSEGGKNHGTHWTALVVMGQQSLFFDPFGIYPSTEIREFIKKRKGCHLAFTTKEIQDLHSSLCGYFCLGFLIYLDRGKGPEEYMRLFSENDTKGNDRIMKTVIKQF